MIIGEEEMTMSDDNIVPCLALEQRRKLKNLPEETLFQMRLLLLQNENIDLKKPMWGMWLDKNRVEYHGDERTGKPYLRLVKS